MKTLIDTHAHLQNSAFASDQEAVIQRAFASGLKYIINVSYDFPSSQQAVQLAHIYERIFATVGIHPHEAVGWRRDVAKELEILIESKKVVAIGEIGLDYHGAVSPKNKQQEVFDRQLELASRLKLPVVIHNRQATEEVLSTLKNFRGQTGVIHCYSGDLIQAEKFIELGYYLGITGNLTFPKNLILKEVVSKISLERLVVETDAPYLSVQLERGKRNEPSQVRYVAGEIARLKKLDEEIVAKQTTENAIRLFRLPEDK